jgi:Leucine Rich repeat
MKQYIYDMNKASLKELIEGIKYIQCLRILDLSFCNLNDELEEEIAEIFSIEKLEFINLKSNHLSKKSAITIGKKLKEFKNHIGFLE